MYSRERITPVNKTLTVLMYTVRMCFRVYMSLDFKAIETEKDVSIVNSYEALSKYVLIVAVLAVFGVAQTVSY